MFLEERFPDDISYGSIGGPSYKTDIIQTKSGKEIRNIHWHNGRAVYDVAPALKNEEQIKSVMAFFRVVRGKAIGFRFKDWTDFSSSKSLIGVGDAQKSEFQLIKQYQTGQQRIERKIHKPVQDTVKIYTANNLLTQGVAIDNSNGKVRFSSPPAIGVEIRADFEFDVPVRFDTDRLMINRLNLNLYSCGRVQLVEIDPDHT